MIWVTEAKALPNFRLWVSFNNGTEGKVNLKDFIANDSRPIVTACATRSPSWHSG